MVNVYILRMYRGSNYQIKKRTISTDGDVELDLVTVSMFVTTRFGTSSFCKKKNSHTFPFYFAHLRTHRVRGNVTQLDDTASISQRTRQKIDSPFRALDMKSKRERRLQQEVTRFLVIHAGRSRT